MKIVILSAFKNKYSTKRLVAEGKERGHEVLVINPLNCYMDISTEQPMVYFQKKRLDDVDVVIPRIGATVSAYGMAIVRQFEMMGTYCLNSSMAIGRSRDKLRSLQILSQQELPLPKTSFANSTKQTDQLIRLVGGAPAVVKLLEGSQGKGVVLAETQSAAQSLIDAFRELQANFLVQEFIKDADGSDVRCFVVGGKVVASMMRKAKKGEFRSNLHRGGTGEKVRLSSEEKRIAIAAAKAMRLNVAGVDIIRSGSGPKILEVNSSPGLEGIENVSEINVAKSIIIYCEKNFWNKSSDN